MHPTSVSPERTCLNWDSLRQWVEAETGMDLSGSREPRLRDAVQRALSHQQPATTLERILAQPEGRGPFLEQLATELTIGESFFFRNEHHFQALRSRVIPSILKDNASKREIRIWTAGCATGEEPYSLAILLDQILPRNEAWKVSILATDLNPAFLARARQGRYRPWSFRQTSIHQDRRYFTPEGEWLVLSSAVRDRVRFSYLNLVKDVYPSALTGTLGLDLILFRNVAIYLKPEVIRAILERFHRSLRPGGWLLLGETEVSQAPTDGFKSLHYEQATFFHKQVEASSKSEKTVPPPVSVLASFWTSKCVSSPTVPALPDWVPLPTTAAASDKARKSRSEDQVTALSLWEQVERCLARSDRNGAERLIDRIASPKERAVARLRYVRTLLGSAENGRAREILELCLLEEPLLIEAQLLRASFAEEAGDLAVAEQAYRRALYVDRNCLMAHFQLALVQQQQGDRVGMMRSLRTTQQLMQAKEPHSIVEYGEGVCYGRLREMVSLLMGDSL